MMKSGNSTGIRCISTSVFLVAVVLLFARLGDLPLISPDEGRNAEVAREMLASGAWLVPTYNGIVYLDKPACYFSTVALSFALFGENEWAARFPSALSALSILILLFLFCRIAYGRFTAALAVLIVAASPLFLIFARMVIFDMPLALFVLISILAAFLAEEEGRRSKRGWSALSAAAAGVATLIKGPVGFIVPGLVIMAHGLLRSSPHEPRGRLRMMRQFFSPLNLIIFFGLTLTWFLGLVHRQPDFLRYGLVEETFRRYTTTAFHRTEPFYYYAPVLLATFFPWSLLLPEAAVEAWRLRREWIPEDRLFITCALVIMLFFSTSQSKLPGYILVAVIALGVLTARTFSRALQNPSGRGFRIIRRGSLILAAVCLTAGLLLVLDFTTPGWLQRSFHIRSVEYDRLQPAVFPLTITLLAMAATAYLAWRLRRVWLSLIVFASFSFSLLTLNFGALRSYARDASSRSLARAIEKSLARESSLPSLHGERTGDIRIAALEYFSTGLPFYLKHQVILFTRDGHEMTSNYLVFLLRNAGGEAVGRAWPEGVVKYACRESWLDSRDDPVYILAGKHSRPELERIVQARGTGVQEISPGVWGALIDPVSKCSRQRNAEHHSPSL